MRTVCVLLCLTLISVYMTSGLYAKYTAKSNIEDSARVITFGDITLTESGDFNSVGTLTIIPGVDLTKKAEINFDGSESSTSVFVKLNLSSQWETLDNKNFLINKSGVLQMQWKIADDWQFLEKDDNCYIYYRELAPNTPLNTNVINNNTIKVSDQITKNEIADLTGIYIEISATAVQSNGFENAKFAWDSIAKKEG